MSVTIKFDWRICCRWLLGLLFLWSALSKVANLQDFYGSLLSYRLPLPETLLQITAVILPWLELFCGIGLVSGIWTEAALLWAVGLFLIFALATGQAWVRGLEISCGCFDLSLLGLGPHRLETVTGVVQSAVFAFFRSLVLGTGALYLLRHALAANPPQAAT